ncbi:hypothetical protein RRG08_031573 [Elysia crispata]|uniref:Uncharacterized protein n=1 Tax=Elysia crispata TaxID=231223 RepID=A0AAE1B2N3_9GAST|nr:hypothetical protein RRG08_031573 [Elysia crispata]
MMVNECSEQEIHDTHVVMVFSIVLCRPQINEVKSLFCGDDQPSAPEIQHRPFVRKISLRYREGNVSRKTMFDSDPNITFSGELDVDSEGNADGSVTVTVSIPI